MSGCGWKGPAPRPKPALARLRVPVRFFDLDQPTGRLRGSTIWLSHDVGTHSPLSRLGLAVGFRVAHGLLERPVYREFFAAGLTVLDPIEGFESAAIPARLEVQNLIREIGLIDEASLEDEAFHEVELGMPDAEAKDVAGVDYSTNILAYSALSENGRAIRSQEMQKLLLGYRDNMRVEVETGISVTAETVADLRALTAWPDGLALNIHVDLDPRFSVVRVERAS